MELRTSLLTGAGNSILCEINLRLCLKILLLITAFLYIFPIQLDQKFLRRYFYFSINFETFIFRIFGVANVKCKSFLALSYGLGSFLFLFSQPVFLSVFLFNNFLKFDPVPISKDLTKEHLQEYLQYRFGLSR